MKPAFYEEVYNARIRAREMRTEGFSSSHAARLLACEFFINIYATAAFIWASYVNDEGKEVRVKLA